MPRPFKRESKTFRHRLEARLEDLTNQTEDLRQQIVDRAPGVRDQLFEQAEDFRKQVVDRAPAVRDQMLAALPDKEQLLDLRDDLFDRLPENVQERLPEKVKPKHSRLKKVAVVGAVTGAGAAAFAVLRRRGTAPTPAAPFPEPARSAPVTPPPAEARTTKPVETEDEPKAEVTKKP